MSFDLFCRCDRCSTAARVETGNAIPRHWGRSFSDEHGLRDLCPGCIRGIALLARPPEDDPEDV